MIDVTTKDKRKMLCIECGSDELLQQRMGGTATVTAKVARSSMKKNI